MEIAPDVQDSKPVKAKKPISEAQKLARQENVKKMNEARAKKKLELATTPAQPIVPPTPALEFVDEEEESDDEEDKVRQEVAQIIDEKLSLFYAERLKPRIRKIKDKIAAPPPFVPPKKVKSSAPIAIPKPTPASNPFAKW